MESGDLIADAQLQATQSASLGGAQFAFMNAGGVRHPGFVNPAVPAVYPDDVTYGNAFTVQPFGNSLVTMTLTTPHCPVAETMPGEVEMRVMSVPGIATAEVNLVWDPAWDPGKMTDEAKLELGML